MRNIATIVLATASTGLGWNGSVGAQTLADLYPELATLVNAESGGDLYADHFGSAVAIDGDTLVVGIPEDDLNSSGDHGSVKVFVRNGTAWTLQQTLTAFDADYDDLFGSSVAISGDTIVVGVPGDTAYSINRCGSARVFLRYGSTWSEQDTLFAVDRAPWDKFGAAVAISGQMYRLHFLRQVEAGIHAASPRSSRRCCAGVR